jgi:hypothetical protein
MKRKLIDGFHLMIPPRNEREKIDIFLGHAVQVFIEYTS